MTATFFIQMPIYNPISPGMLYHQNYAVGLNDPGVTATSCLVIGYRFKEYNTMPLELDLANTIDFEELIFI